MGMSGHVTNTHHDISCIIQPETVCMRYENSSRIQLRWTGVAGGVWEQGV